MSSHREALVISVCSLVIVLVLMFFLLGCQMPLRDETGASTLLLR